MAAPTRTPDAALLQDLVYALTLKPTATHTHIASSTKTPTAALLQDPMPVPTLKPMEVPTPMVAPHKDINRCSHTRPRLVIVHGTLLPAPVCVFFFEGRKSCVLSPDRWNHGTVVGAVFGLLVGCITIVNITTG